MACFIGQVSGLVVHMWEFMPSCLKLNDIFRMCLTINIGVFMYVKWTFDFCDTHWF